VQPAGTVSGRRHWAILPPLLGCGLPRADVAASTV